MIRRSLLFVLLGLLAAGCSLTPEKPVTREALMKTRIYSDFTIIESPDEVLEELNKTGEVVIEAKRTVRGKEYPIHIKILATSDGLEVLDYDR